MSSTEAEPRLSQPHASTASLGAKVAGVTLFGVTVKTYQNLIQKRHPLSGGRAHLINAGVWAGIGYLWYYAEQRQQQLLYKIDSAKLGAREAPRGEGQSTEQGTALPS